MKVKSLEWIVRGKSVGPVVYAGAFGVTLFYSISGKEGDWTLSYPGADCMIHVDGFGTQHSAREAAQVDYVARASDAIEKGASPAPLSPLMPIETAPKDGTWFLAYREAADCGSWDRFVVVRWHDEFSDFIWPDQPFDIFNDDIDEIRENGFHVQSPYESTGTFTAWCPLPVYNPAPSSRESGR